MASAWGSSWGVAWASSWGAASPIVVIDTHDGGEEKRREAYKQHQEKRLAQIREAFYAVAESPIANEVRQHAQGTTVDFEALSRDVERVSRLLAVYQRLLNEDDEAAALILL